MDVYAVNVAGEAISADVVAFLKDKYCFSILDGLVCNDGTEQTASYDEQIIMGHGEPFEG